MARSPQRLQFGRRWCAEVERNMSVDLSPDSVPEKKKPRARKSQLKVVFDTNALYVTPTSIGSASDLVRHEIANAISEAKYAELDIFWYLPEIVRHERQYQMQAEALKLRTAINKIERLLSHNLALTDRTLLDHVKTKIEEKERELGLQEIKLDHSLIDWTKLILAAAYRNPPFEVGEKEKGFRDALVAESFLQLLAESPKTPHLCRVVLVTSDQLLTQAVKDRTADSPNASVLANVEELKGLINTIVSNVGEDFIALIKPKAAKLFFVSSGEKQTVFYREKIKEQLTEKFKAELEARPQGTAFRNNVAWLIDRPNFSRKEGRRVFWTSRIEIELEAGTVTRDDDPKETAYLSDLLSPSWTQLMAPKAQKVSLNSLAHTNVFNSVLNSQDIGWAGLNPSLQSLASEKRAVTHKGRDLFAVLWSTEVAMSKELKKPIIEDITHVELSCQPIS
jgi:hypothetical protein